MRVHLPPILETLKRLKFKTNQQAGLLGMRGLHTIGSSKGTAAAQKQPVPVEWKVSAETQQRPCSVSLQEAQGCQVASGLGVGGLALTCRCVLFSSQNNSKFSEISCVNVVWGFFVN